MTTSPPRGDADIAATTAKLCEAASRSKEEDLPRSGAGTTNIVPAVLGLDFML
jgi:hypothetical protein